MIHGLIIHEKQSPYSVLEFKCTCGEIHRIFVWEKPFETVQIPDSSGKLHNVNVWGYKLKNDIAEIDQALLFDTAELHPSFDNSKECGWHSPPRWTVKVMIVENERQKIHDDFLHEVEE